MLRIISPRAQIPLCHPPTSGALACGPLLPLGFLTSASLYDVSTLENSRLYVGFQSLLFSVYFSRMLFLLHTIHLSVRPLTMSLVLTFPQNSRIISRMIKHSSFLGQPLFRLNIPL